MEKCRYHEMLPHEILERRAKFPVAFVPLGTLEFHGFHLAVGNDGLKAEKLCELAAERSGGFAFPTMWYGEPRSKAILEVDFAEHCEHCMGFHREKASPAVFGKDFEQQWQFYRDLIRHMLLELRHMEMKAVCLVCGHYPLHGNAAGPVVKQFNAEFRDIQAFSAIEPEYCGKDDPDAGGDHAGPWETSYLMYLRPECVDLSVFNANPDFNGCSGGDPRPTSSVAMGRRGCERIADAMAAKARELLKCVEGQATKP